MRIAFISFEYPPFIIGGAGIYALNITHELAKLGHQVVVFTPNISEHTLRSELHNLEIQKVSVNKKLPFKALQFWLRLPNEIKKIEDETKFDIVHFNGLSYWFLQKRLSKAKHIVTVHHLVIDSIKNNNLSFISRMKDISGENSFFVSFVEKKCIKSPDRLVAVSSFTKKQIIESYDIDSDKIEVIYNGIDLNGYSFNEYETENTKKQLHLMERPVLLFVGRIDDPRKNLSFLLTALNKVLDVMDVTLLVVGKGDQTKARKLIDFLGISNNVVFTGFLDDNSLKKYYSLCDIYVCPSKLEGFGLTLVEAMAAKKPIVATNVGAVPEIVKDGINGILVKSGDLDDMCLAICTLLKNPKMINDISKNNAENVDEKFSWNKNVRKLLELYAD
jgi:glycogen synthase